MSNLDDDAISLDDRDDLVLVGRDEPLSRLDGFRGILDDEHGDLVPDDAA